MYAPEACSIIIRSDQTPRAPGRRAAVHGEGWRERTNAVPRGTHGPASAQNPSLGAELVNLDPSETFVWSKATLTGDERYRLEPHVISVPGPPILLKGHVSLVGCTPAKVARSECERTLYISRGLYS